tara:strand:+ start:599 stop:1270 length:672 start_codon:yes stop_codon:yes gene_type:complete
MRGGSKGIKNKSIALVNNKPLFTYTLNQIKKIKFIDKIVVSTDSKKIYNITSKYGVENWFLRPKNLSKDSSPKIPVIRDALIRSEKYYDKKFDIIIDLDVTSPLRNIKDIKNSFKKFFSKKAEILFTVTKSKKNPYFNMVEIKNSNVNLVKKNQIISRRQDAPSVFDMNASIYIWKRKTLMKYNTLFIKKTTIYEMPEERSIDIDTSLDLKLVEYLLRNNHDK